MFSHPVMSDFLGPHGLQHARLPCPSPSSGVHPIHVQWVGDAIQPSHHLTPQSFPVSGTFPMSWLFASDDQNTGVSASASVLLISIQGWSPLRLTGLKVQGTFRSLLQHHSLKASILWCSAFFTVQLSQLYMTTGKTIALTLWTFVVCHSFPAKKKSSSDFMAAVTIHSDFRAQEEEICHCFHLFPFYLSWSNGAMILVYFNI